MGGDFSREIWSEECLSGEFMRQARMPGFQPAGLKVRRVQVAPESRQPVGLRSVFSAGLGSPALRQAKMPAATLTAISNRIPRLPRLPSAFAICSNARV